MRCLNAKFYVLFSEWRQDAAQFLGSILHHANLFSMILVFRLDGTVMHYKL